MYLHTTDFLPICTHFHTHTHTHAHPLTCTPPHKHMHTPHIHMPPPPHIHMPPPPHIHMHTPHIHMSPPLHIHMHTPSHIYSYTHARIHTHKQNAPFVFFSSFFSLSLIDSSLTYQNVTAVLRTLIDWHALGVELGVHKSQLDMIEGDYSHTRRRRNELINVWLSNDTQASWRKLCRALEDIDNRALAAEIRSQYCHS